MDRPRSPAHPHVRLATMATVLCVMVLGLLGSPLTTTAAHAANDCTQPLECVRLTPGTDVGRLNLFDRNGAGPGLLDWADESGGTGQANQEWKLNRPNDDGTFQLKNNNSGTCLAVDIPNAFPDVTAGQECANKPNQLWILEPRPGDDGFTLRNVAHDGQCLGNNGKTFGAFKMATLADCGSAASVKWTLSDKAVGDPAKELASYKGIAATYALSKCLKDATYCNFKAEKNGPPVPGSGICVEFYSPSLKDDTVTFNEKETSSYSETIGSSVLKGVDITASVKFGDLGFESKFSQNWQSSISKTTLNGKEFGSSAPQARKAGEYGWLIYRPLISSQKGTYTFDKGSWSEWTYAGSFDVPLGSGSTTTAAGSWEKNSGTTPPPECSGVTPKTAPTA
ncbi:RICIN domain-containing protein [Streptomyces platensis]|uniref:RICIN domain-containing protein n=1 Tax=Streptomyces platensis TaxID=58346 RepID=UPI0037ADC0DD